MEKRTVEWNRQVWETYPWPQDGDEWSEMAEFSRVPYAAWKESLVRTFVAPYAGFGTNVLEIGCGHGRWSAQIHARIRGGVLFLVDLSEKSIRHCKRLFAAHDNVSFTVNDGKSLPEPPFVASRIDFVFSFDTFVHVEEPEFRGYARELARVMKPVAMGVIHHPGSPTPEQRARGCRSALSGPLVAKILRENGFFVIRQTDAWEGGNVKFAGDLITVFAKP